MGVSLNDPPFIQGITGCSLDGTDFTGSAPKYPVLSKVRPEDGNIQKTKLPDSHEDRIGEIWQNGSKMVKMVKMTS